MLQEGIYLYLRSISDSSLEKNSIDLTFQFNTFGVKVVDALKHGHQAMVFVHSRKDTAKTAEKLVYCFHSVHLLYESIWLPVIADALELTCNLFL